MSLFKCQDWWYSPDESNEEICSWGHMDIGNVVNKNPPNNAVVTADFLGKLKIYSPQYTLNMEEDGSGYLPHHLLLECINYINSGNSNQHICILHPENFAVYTLKSINLKYSTGATKNIDEDLEKDEKKGIHLAEGSQYTLIKNYQQHFKNKAYNFVSGSFGSIEGRHFIAVQFLDGQITFYEQDNPGVPAAVSPNLLPGPLAYMVSTDSIVIQNPDWTLIAYKYHSIASDFDRSSNKKILSSWTKILPETAVDMQVVISSEGALFLLVLTKRNFYCFKDSGGLKFSKKLQFDPSCFISYMNGETVHWCVATHSRTILVFCQSELKWVSQVNFVPVQILRADFEGISGSLVLLSGNGSVGVYYFGTTPSLFIAPPTEYADVDYQEADKELAQLNEFIKQSTKNEEVLSLTKIDPDLLVSTFLADIEPWVGVTQIQEHAVPSIPLIIKLTTKAPLTNVRVTVNVDGPLDVTQRNFCLNTICDTCQLLVKFYLSKPVIAHNLTVSIVTSYILSSGAPVIVTKSLDLPITLVISPTKPQKEAEHKITVSNNRDIVDLQEIFPEFKNDESSNTAIGFKHIGTENAVTLLASRTSNRYRIQSDHLPSIWIIFQALKLRLESFWRVDSKKTDLTDLEQFKIEISSSAPISNLISLMNNRFSLKNTWLELNKELELRATQFRVVEKRLLIKFKDKTPSPLANLEHVVEGSYNQILQVLFDLNSHKQKLEEVSYELSAVLRLVIEIICINSELDCEKRRIFNSVFNPNIDQDWEETNDKMLSFALKIFTSKPDEHVGVPVIISRPLDFSKFKKHTTFFLDKVSKNSDLLLELRGKLNNVSKNEMEKSDLSSESQQDVSVLPPGSALGENRVKSARLRSARIRFEPKAEILKEENETDINVIDRKELRDDLEPQLSTSNDNFAALRYNEDQAGLKPNYRDISSKSETGLENFKNVEPIYEEIPENSTSSGYSAPPATSRYTDKNHEHNLVNSNLASALENLKINTNNGNQFNNRNQTYQNELLDQTDQNLNSTRIDQNEINILNPPTIEEERATESQTELIEKGNKIQRISSAMELDALKKKAGGAIEGPDQIFANPFGEDEW